MAVHVVPVLVVGKEMWYYKVRYPFLILALVLLASMAKVYISDTEAPLHDLYNL